MDAQKEIRKAEIRSASGRTVSGYAVRFETESVNMGFVEVVKRGAITDETIKTSDVFALLNHNENTVLARSNHGVGSLTLRVDNDGVYYEFEAPNTANGEELLEHIKRGEISQSSFAFTVSNEDGAESWMKRSDGVIVRQINKISRLYDISPVYQPAYTETTCSRRALEKLSELNKNMEDNKDLHNEADLQEIELLKAIIEEQEQKIKELQEAQTEPTDENRADDEDEKKDEIEPSDTQINNTESEQTESEPTDESTDETETDEDEEKDKNKNNRNISKMEKFSLTKEIRSAIESGTNKIDMRAYTVSDEGTDVVGTDVFDIFAPLRAKNVLTDAGVRVITGIKNNIQVPVFGATEAKFANETADASNGSGAITSVKLSPKRVTAKVPVSLELLAQDSVGIENMIREDLQNAVYAAVEDKVFGRQAESTDVYAGLCKWPANSSILDGSTYAGITNAEATVEGIGVDTTKCKWIVSPSAKAKLRAMPKSSKSTQLTMEGGEIDGTPVLSTGHLNDVSINALYGNWSDVVLASWDNVQLDVVRDTASLTAGTVNIVVNAYVDMKCVRPNAISYVKI